MGDAVSRRARPLHPDGPLLDELATRVDEELRDALGGARDVALVNFPNHNNPGDSAIWLGTRRSLRRLGVRVRYQCAWCTYSPEALRRALPSGPVLVNGGGNFGDLYAGQQGLRERLLAELVDRPIIQLPQSIHFRDPANAERMRRLIASHGGVTLMVREETSERIARRMFDASVRLVPDMALALRRLDVTRGRPGADVLWLHRVEGDPEYVDHGVRFGPAAREVEWLHGQDDEPAWLRRHAVARRVNDRLVDRCRSRPGWARRAWRPLAATFVPLGEGYVRRGMAIMAGGRVLVTDKLHGHLLALLAGIPHVVLDNSYGKVSGIYRTWTRSSSLTHWADDGDEAERLVSGLLRDDGVKDDFR